jgi:hypothetical protein
MSPTIDWSKPRELSDLDVAFSFNANGWMPDMAEIPVEFKHRQSKWNDVFNALFFNMPNVNLEDLQAKPGIDRIHAIRHILSIMKSYTPKHEHKEAACAFLMSQWFEPIQK